MTASPFVVLRALDHAERAAVAEIERAHLRAVADAADLSRRLAEAADHVRALLAQRETAAVSGHSAPTRGETAA